MTITIGQTGVSNVGALGFTAQPNRVVVSVIAGRATDPTITPQAGWTTLVSQHVSGRNDNVFMFARIADGGETSALGGAGVPVSAASFELIGANLTGAAGSGTNGSGGSSPTAPAQTPTAGASCVVVGGFMQAIIGNLSATGPTGVVGVGGTTPPSGQTDWPRTLASYVIIPSASGSYTPIASTASSSWAAGSAVIYEGAIPPSLSHARTAQAVAEVLELDSITRARMAAAVAEVLELDSVTRARMAQNVVEVLEGAPAAQKFQAIWIR